MTHFEDLTVGQLKKEISRMSILEKEIDSMLYLTFHIRECYWNEKFKDQSGIENLNLVEKVEFIKKIIENIYSDTNLEGMKKEKREFKEWVSQQEARIAKVHEILIEREKKLNKEVTNHLIAE